MLIYRKHHRPDSSCKNAVKSHSNYYFIIYASADGLKRSRAQCAFCCVIFLAFHLDRLLRFFSSVLQYKLDPFHGNFMFLNESNKYNENENIKN